MLNPRAIAGLVGLVVALGAIFGALWEGALVCSARWSSKIVAFVWSAYAAGCGFLLALRLGAFAHWHGRYHKLAEELLALSGAFAIGFAFLLIALASSRSHPLGYAAESRARVRVGLAILSSLLAIASMVVDGGMLVGLYPEAHFALRLVATWLLACALSLFVPAAEKSARFAWIGAIFAIGAGLVVAQMTSREFSAFAKTRWSATLIDVARNLTDIDRDGYSSLFAGGDCAPLDPKINPGAAEIPNNGVDDNCLAGDAKILAAKHETLTPPSDPAPIDVFLVTIDSLRRDRVGVYCPECGPNGLATTPEIDAFAEHAVVFDHAYAPGGWTAISVSAFMRGVYARRLDLTRMFETSRYRLLRASERNDLHSDESLVKMFAMPVSDVHTSIAEWLGTRGMTTIGIADDGYSDLLGPRANVAPGFDTYRLVNAGESSEHDDHDTADMAIAELAAAPVDERIFMWVHFFGPHNPSERHPGVRYDGPDTIPAYEHEIRYADMHVGRLLRAIEARGKPAAIFVTADHGEEFIAGDRHHGWSLEEDAIRVPFIASVPNWRAGRSNAPISLVDLMPTFCALTHTPPPANLDGVAIDPSRSNPRWLIADTWQFDGNGKLVRDEATALDGTTKAVHDALRDTWWITDLQRSPPISKPTESRADVPAVRALAKYLESASGPAAAHD